MNMNGRIALATALVLVIGQTISSGKEGRLNRKTAADDVKAKRSEATDTAKEKRAQAKEHVAEKREKSKETVEKSKEAIADKVSDRTEARQEHQSKRIEEGIKKGYLTTDEISKLDTQQKAIEASQQSFMSDGKVTRNEGQQLRQQLNEASMCIFAEKHDADGNTKSVLRLGKNVTLRNDVAQKLGDENLSRQDARAYLKDFHRMVEVKKTLSSGTISDEQRSKLQAEYNEMLNKYFETK